MSRHIFVCIHFASFYDFAIGFWNCSDSVNFFVIHLNFSYNLIKIGSFVYFFD